MIVIVVIQVLGVPFQYYWDSDTNKELENINLKGNILQATT